MTLNLTKKQRDLLDLIVRDGPLTSKQSNHDWSIMQALITKGYVEKSGRVVTSEIRKLDGSMYQYTAATYRAK